MGGVQNSQVPGFQKQHNIYLFSFVYGWGKKGTSVGVVYLLFIAMIPIDCKITNFSLYLFVYFFVVNPNIMDVFPLPKKAVQPRKTTHTHTHTRTSMHKQILTSPSLMYIPIQSVSSCISLTVGWSESHISPTHTVATRSCDQHTYHHGNTVEPKLSFDYQNAEPTAHRIFLNQCTFYQSI